MGVIGRCAVYSSTQVMTGGTRFLQMGCFYCLKTFDFPCSQVENNVSIQLEKAQGDAYEVMGRGELQLAILVENMRREGEREECVRDIDKR